MVFKTGDFIRNKNPYKGESEYMVIEIDTKNNEYSCATMKGKHCKEPDFYNRVLLRFEDAHSSYVKVG